MAPPKRCDKGKAVASPSKRSRPSSGSHSDEYDGNLFRSLHAFEFYSSDIVARKVHMGKRIDFEFFAGAGFDLEGLFDALGWVPYVSMNEKVYPHLVNLFYANLVVSDKKISTYVKGVHIPLRVSLLSEVMEIPVLQEVHYKSALDHRPEAYRRILEADVDPLHIERVNANSFSTLHRFLHKLVCSILVPRSGSMDGVTDDHILLIQALLDGSHVDLPNITLNYIRDVIGVPKRSLIYGMLITRILRKFKVNFSGEESKSLSGFDVIYSGTLARMKMSIQDGVFVRTVSRTPQKGQGPLDDAGDEFCLSTPGTTPSPSQPSASVDQLTQLFSDFSTSVFARFDSMDTRLDAMDYKTLNLALLNPRLMIFAQIFMCSRCSKIGLRIDPESLRESTPFKWHVLQPNQSRPRPSTGVDPDCVQFFRVDPSPSRESTSVQQKLFSSKGVDPQFVLESTLTLLESTPAKVGVDPGLQNFMKSAF
ncbi:hypothetical protein Taro_035415 [Colocasia esculenta]|uniref:Putative plant transposon protein domain-containing protein n=1 Tax=Colocasia esculenta TaxID=4460 RepID=A0A843VYX6_COLES|nr:hypothetical protein [Colocasia esculenta]